MKFSDQDEISQPLTMGNGSKPTRLANGNSHHIITITPVREVDEDEIDDDRFVTVYTPTTISVENGGAVKLTPKINELVDHQKPKAYIYPMVQSGSASDTSAQSTPSDSRSMCDTPEHWTIPELRSTGPAWKDMNPVQKARHVGIIVGKLLSLLALLYFFICSLDLLSTAFKLLGSRAVGRFFSDSELLQNPVVGLMIGVLVTVLVQSSSTSTSIVVTMVASKIIYVRQAIPIVMGANIGTSVTNTIVSLMQSADRNEFRRAFAAATVHDMFNWLTVLVLLPIEVSTRYLEKITTWLVNKENVQQDKTANREFLNKLTKPLTNMIIQVDKNLMERLAGGNDTSDPSERLLILCCDENDTCQPNCRESFFGILGFGDTATGIVLLILSIIVLCTCLIILVKVLNSMLTGHIAKLIKRTMNRKYDFPYSIISDYLAIFAGCILTILVQSSSIFTSTLTPLAGIGVISLEKIYPLTLGSNIGTTTTGILAALAADSNRIHDTLQLALCHLFFNISGILLFYPIPCMRLPIPMARLLGNITANYRWFSILYLISMFFVLPLIVFSLSTLGTVAMISIGGPIFILLAIVIIINIIQHYHSTWLPVWFQDWHFLPLWMRSLKPLDRLIIKITRKFGCANCCGTDVVPIPIAKVCAEKHDHQPDSTAASQLNILGSLYKSNSVSQFENIIYNQGRLGMMFHGFGNHHTIHGHYNLHGTKRSHRHQHQHNRDHRKSMAPAYNRAFSNNNNNNNDDPFEADPSETSGELMFNHHTVHNPCEVHRYYPSSPFMTPTRTPNGRLPLEDAVAPPPPPSTTTTTTTMLPTLPSTPNNNEANSKDNLQMNKNQTSEQSLPFSTSSPMLPPPQPSQQQQEQQLPPPPPPSSSSITTPTPIDDATIVPFETNL